MFLFVVVVLFLFFLLSFFFWNFFYHSSFLPSFIHSFLPSFLLFSDGIFVCFIFLFLWFLFSLYPSTPTHKYVFVTFKKFFSFCFTTLIWRLVRKKISKKQKKKTGKQIMFSYIHFPTFKIKNGFYLMKNYRNFFKSKSLTNLKYSFKYITKKMKGKIERVDVV